MEIEEKEKAEKKKRGTKTPVVINEYLLLTSFIFLHLKRATFPLVNSEEALKQKGK